MTPEVNTLLTRIGDALIEAAREGWTSIRIDMAFYRDGYELKAAYVDANGIWKRDFTPPDLIRKSFKAMRNIYRDSGQPVWGQVCYTVSMDGKFNLQLGYENIDANGNTIIDEAS